MDNESSYRKEVCVSEYRVEWSDQKITIDCRCGEKEIEIFSDSFTYCSKCGRRYSILELIQVEIPMDLERDEIEGIDLIEYIEKREIGE